MTGLLKIGGSILGASKKKKASKKAQASLEAANEKIRAEYAANAVKAENTFAPAVAVGEVGLKALTDGFASGDFTRSFAADDFKTDPGYEFRVAEGQKAVGAAASAKGGYYSGAQLKALDSFNQNIASEEYGKAYNRYTGEQARRYDVAQGLTAVGTNANNAITGARNLSTAGITSSLGDTGRVQAQGALERGQISANLISNVVNDATSAITDAVSLGSGSSLSSLASIFKRAPRAGASSGFGS